MPCQLSIRGTVGPRPPGGLGHGAFVRLLAVLCMVVSLAGLLDGCSKPPDEAQIRAAIDAMARAVQDKDRTAFVEHLSPEFKAGNGMDQRGLAQLMLFEFRRNKQIGVYVVDTDVKVDGAWANAVLHVAVTGTGDWLPERARYYRVSMRWHKRDGQWRVRRARWESVMAPAR